jgi:hypothetical protein
MSEYKVAQGFKFFDQSKLSTDDFIEICFTVFAANTNIVDIYAYSEVSEQEKIALDLIKDKIDLTVDEIDMLSVKKAHLLRKLIIQQAKIK